MYFTTKEARMTQEALFIGFKSECDKSTLTKILDKLQVITEAKAKEFAMRKFLLKSTTYGSVFGSGLRLSLFTEPKGKADPLIIQPSPNWFESWIHPHNA